MSFIKPVEGFCQHIGIAVASATNGDFDAGFAEPSGVPNGQILRPAIAVMHEGFIGPTVVQRLLQFIKPEVRCHESADTPTYNPTRINVNVKGWLCRDNGVRPLVFERCSD